MGAAFGKAVTGNVALVAPAGTVTTMLRVSKGPVSNVLVVPGGTFTAIGERTSAVVDIASTVTSAPPGGAGASKVTVPVAGAGPTTLLGLIVIPIGLVTGALTVIVVPTV